MQIFLFIISFIFLLAGAVNLGAFGIFPATPFLFIILYLVYKKRGTYLIAGIVSLIIVASVYSLRLYKIEFFLNSIGREVITLQDLCLTKYGGEEEFVLAMDMKNTKDCDSSNIGGASKWEVLKSGTKLRIDDINISHADMGEHYSIVSKVELGKLTHLYPHYVSFDGKIPLAADDLRYGIFYWLSLLMYWPVSPIMILTMF